MKYNIETTIDGRDYSMSEDFKWFVENYDSLFSEYGYAFLAIKDKKIIGVYPTYADGVRGAAKICPVGTFIVQECNGNPSAYTCHIASTFA